jgi:hypothetical protein
MRGLGLVCRNKPYLLEKGVAVSDDSSDSYLGVFPDTRPVSYSFQIQNDTPPDPFETSRFDVQNGAVAVSCLASWSPSSVDEPRNYGVTLVKWGVLSDQDISPTWSLAEGTRSRANWSGLSAGSYYLRITVPTNVGSANAVFSGTVDVS